MNRFTAAVIGLGNIGQGYDYDDHDGSLILTHAGGFLRHNGFDLVASVDPNQRQRDLFISKYQHPAYSTIEELFTNHHPDVVSIAVPTNLHSSVFQMVSKQGPVAVLCEKPIAGSMAEAESMVAQSQSAGFPLQVNFIRRYEPGVLVLRKAIADGLLGTIYKGTVWYTKGFRNNGSHFVDLLRFLLGDVAGYHIIATGQKNQNGDPEPDVSIRFGGADVCFLAGRHDFFSLAEIELVGTGGLLRYVDGGRVIEYQRVEQDTVFTNHRTLSRCKENITTDLNRYQWHVLEALHRHLTDGVPLASDGNSALVTMATIEEICNAL